MVYGCRGGSPAGRPEAEVSPRCAMASVLLVDDNPDLIQEQVAHVFGGAGHEIGVASDR